MCFVASFSLVAYQYQEEQILIFGKLNRKKKTVLFLLFAFKVLGRRINSTNPRVGPRDIFFPVPRDTLFERRAS